MAEGQERAGIQTTAKPDTSSERGQLQRPVEGISHSSSSSKGELLKFDQQLTETAIQKPEEARGVLKDLASESDEVKQPQTPEQTQSSEQTTEQPTEIAEQQGLSSETLANNQTTGEESDTSDRLEFENEAETKKIDSPAFLISQIFKGNTQQAIESLKESNEPKKRALANDFEQAILSREITSLESQKRSIPKEEKEIYEKKVNTKKERLAVLRKEREQIKDENGQLIDNQITQFVKTVVGSEDKSLVKKIDEDPLGVLEQRIDQAANNKKSREDLLRQIENSQLGEEDKNIIKQLINLSAEENTELRKKQALSIVEKSKKIGQTTFSLAALLVFITLWRSMRSELSPQQQG